MQTPIIVPIIIYLIAVFSISLYAYVKREKVDSFTDYFIGNRKMGGFLLAMTLTATYISASSFIGGPGAAYKFGLGWVLLAMIQLPAVWFSLGVLGKKFAILARKYQAVTLNDLLLARYQSKPLIWIASTCLLIAFIGAMAVQFIGAGHLLATALAIDYHTCMIVFGVFTVFYTAFGGFRASILNDALQGIVMMIGALLLLGAVIMKIGSISDAVTQLAQIDPALITPYGAEHKLDFPFMASFWVLVCFGLVGLPHTAVRCMAFKDSKAVHSGIVIGTLVVAILMGTMHLTGVLGRVLLPNLVVSDTIIPTLMVHVLPPVAAGLFLAAPLAAIMSTINAQLLQSSATIIKDLYLNLYPEQKNNQARLTFISILVTFMFGMILIACSYHPPKMLFTLNLLSFGALEVVFLWPIVLGLFWQRANAYGAISSMLIGEMSYLLLYAIDQTMPNALCNFQPIVPALLCSIVAFLGGNYIGARKERRLIKKSDWLELSNK